MKTTRTLSILLLMSACGSGPTGGVGGVGGGDLAGQTPADLASNSDGGMCGYPTPPNPEFTCSPTGSGACQSCGDCKQVEDGSAKMASATCGTSCIGSPSATCTKDCLKQKTTLSDGCIGCLDAFYQCLVANCLSPCTVGTAADCAACSRAKPDVGAASCSGMLEQCSGAKANPNYMP